MSILSVRTINPNELASDNYKLAIKISRNGTTNITMALLTSFYHTSFLPRTQEILHSNLPEVLKTQCFNDSDLPFNIEVKNTEIGHLFEHIILEYMCQLKIANGYKKASFRGVTKWNWRKDARGTFHIKIDVRPTDIIFLENALQKSMALLNRILQGKNAYIN